MREFHSNAHALSLLSFILSLISLTSTVHTSPIVLPSSLSLYLHSQTLAATGAADFLPPIVGLTGVVIGFRMMGLVLVLLLLLAGCVAMTAGLDAVLLSDDGPKGIRVRVAGLGPVVAAAAGVFFGVVWSSLLGVRGAGCGAAATFPVDPDPNFFLADDDDDDGGTIREGDFSVLLTIGSELALVVG